MPIYEYRCTTCGFQNEYLQRVNDPLLTDCPDCGKATFNKLISAAGFQLKGNGWYVTDFKNKDNGSKGKPNTNVEKPAESKKEEAKSADPASGTGSGSGARACS